MTKFAERLKELREEKMLTRAELAKEIGTSDRAVGRWETNQRIPNIETLVIIAKYFGETTDYILGLED